MLIDYIDIRKLPDWLVWLDWMFYAYRPSLVVFLLIGVSCWAGYCYVRYGSAVG